MDVENSRGRGVPCSCRAVRRGCAGRGAGTAAARPRRLGLLRPVFGVVPSRRRDAGMVTAEIATVLPAVVALTLALVCVLAAVGAQLRCADLARESVRALARGEAQGSVRTRVLAAAPPDASLTVRRSGGLVTATVRGTAPVVGTRLLRVPGVRVASSATAADEKHLAEQPW